MMTPNPQLTPSTALTPPVREQPWLLASVLAMARLIPRRCGLAFFRLLGDAFFLLARERRRIAAINLEIAFGTALSRAEKARIARACFQNSLALIFDFLKLPQLPIQQQEDCIKIHGEEHLQEAFNLGRGVLAVSAHFGNFPLLLCAMSRRGYPLYVVTRHFNSTWADDLYTGVLARFGTKTFTKDRVAPNILKALKGGAIVGYVLDQNMQRENGCFVDFFEKKACTIKGMATLAARYGSPILPTFIVSTADGMHHIHIEKAFIPDDLKTLTKRDLELTQHFTHLIEAWIKIHPEQWLWFHRRWKTRPEGEAPVYPPKKGLRRSIKLIMRRWRSA